MGSAIVSHVRDLLKKLESFPVDEVTHYGDFQISRLYNYSTNVFTLFSWKRIVVITTDKYVTVLENVKEFEDFSDRPRISYTPSLDYLNKLYKVLTDDEGIEDRYL